jgi:hypothetical protein
MIDFPSLCNLPVVFGILLGPFVPPRSRLTARCTLQQVRRLEAKVRSAHVVVQVPEMSLEEPQHNVGLMAAMTDGAEVRLSVRVFLHPRVRTPPLNFLVDSCRVFTEP